jgi:hypothetical protein
MRHILLATALSFGTLALAATPTEANAQSTYQASRIIPTFSYENVRAVVLELGGSIERTDDETFVVTFSNGMKTNVQLTVCEEEGCYGANVYATFGKPGDKTVAETEALVNDYNARWNAVKAYNRGNGNSTVQNYLICDGGISMENLRMQLAVFEGMLEKMRETIYD